MRTIITSAIGPPGSEEFAEPRQSGPVIFAYDGSSAAEHALGAAARVLAERRALVLVVWKVGLGSGLYPSILPAPQHHPYGLTDLQRGVEPPCPRRRTAVVVAQNRARARLLHPRLPLLLRQAAESGADDD